MHTPQLCPEHSQTFPVRESTAAAGQTERDDMAAHAQESMQLLRQISIKAPQLASVLELLNEGNLERRITFDDRLAPVPGKHRLHAGSALLDMATGLLSQAFPGAAPLFHGCLAYLRLKTTEKKQAWSLRSNG
ncbi:hypothetical protein [Herbaspirillum chlorophenolicum]|uniref:hypothetical protein n=1 Tax=Herbaspirillum chlorophenolicum TaxID=211589 RepID=UPI0012E17F37|nr:hypothetical protein [Herbaspirillum chlorophenolicum]